MNERFMFLWNDGLVWKVDLCTQERTQLGLLISMNEK